MKKIVAIKHNDFVVKFSQMISLPPVCPWQPRLHAGFLLPCTDFVPRLPPPTGRRRDSGDKVVGVAQPVNLSIDRVYWPALTVYYYITVRYLP